MTNQIAHLLQANRIFPQKKWGQNFLVDDTVVQKIADTAALNRTDTVVEVGSGLGALTKTLALIAQWVYTVEFDTNLIPLLCKNLEGLVNVEILNKNILDVDVEKLPRCQTKKYTIVGSIPYSITSPLIHKLLILQPAPTSIVLLIQKEVAEKICATVPDATYLSNFVGTFGKAEIINIVRPESFYPSPGVDSAIMRIIIKPPNRSIAANPAHFQKFLHRGFSSPRKMLNKVFDKGMLCKAGIDPTRRPQTLELKEWIKLCTVC